MTVETDDIFIEHYGVPGMRWGVRRSRSQLAREAKVRSRYSDAPRNLTNDQLKERIQRMETEKRYNDLNSRDVSTGERFAVDIITNVGRSTITAVVGGLAIYAVKAAVEARFGADVASHIPKKKK